MAIYKNTPPTITDGLVLSLDAANPKSYISGSTTWTDISGNNTSGSLVNVEFDSTKKCLLFTSSSQSTCTLNNSSLLNFNTGSFSIETVVQLTATASGNINTLYIKRSGTAGIGGAKGYSYRLNNNTTTTAGTIITVDNGTGANNGDYTYLTPTFPYFNIIHSVLIFNVSTLKLTEYRNGKLTSTVNTGVLTGSFYNTNSNLVLGKLDGNSLDAEYYTFKAYNKVLSEAEIIQNYNATKARFNLT
ncbi:hypothetical protein N9795_00290 [Candidatus Pelagibacter sp.]|nr:hypothetical protein [Candidatus Pelagibacter sp.]